MNIRRMKILANYLRANSLVQKHFDMRYFISLTKRAGENLASVIGRLNNAYQMVATGWSHQGLGCPHSLEQGRSSSPAAGH